MDEDILDMRKPLPIAATTPIFHHSIFTGYIEGIGTGTYVNMQGRDSAFRICYRNTPLATICKQAYELTAVPGNRFFYEQGTDTLLQQTDEWDNWKLRHTYCYEMELSLVPIKKLRSIVRDDITRTFGITLNAARRKMHCWVLQWVGQTLSTQGPAKPDNNLYENNDSLLFLHHQPVSRLISYLNTISSVPVLDETQITTPIYLDFLIQKRKDMTTWQRLLRSLGFELTLQEREIDTYTYSRLP
jgi:hypothetical protein